MKDIVPAMGYNEQQLKDLETTINNAECDVVVDGSPIDLAKLINVNKPVVRVSYDLEEIGSPTIKELLEEFEKEYLK